MAQPPRGKQVAHDQSHDLIGGTALQAGIACDGNETQRQDHHHGKQGQYRHAGEGFLQGCRGTRGINSLNRLRINRRSHADENNG